MEDPGTEGIDYDCSEDFDKKLEFTRFQNERFGYLINYSDGAANRKSDTRRILNKMNPLLDCGETDDIFGGRPGIYTWLLCSVNNKYVIYFKRTIIANEIRSKHGDIVDDVCKDTFDNNQHGLTKVTVFYGGEVRITDGPHFTLNMLSGTYSCDQVDIDPNDQVKSFLTNFISSRSPDSSVNFDTSGKTMIDSVDGETKITEDKLMGLIREGIGLEVFKFSKENAEDLAMWKKVSRRQCNQVMEAKLQYKTVEFERQNKMVKPTETDLQYQKTELDKLRPIPDEIMNKYKMTLNQSFKPQQNQNKSSKYKNFRKRSTRRNKFPKFQKINRKKMARIFRFN